MLPGEFCIKVRKIGTNAFVQGELAFMHLGALFHLNFSCALLLMVSSPLASPWGVGNLWSILSRLCRAVALALGPRDFSLSSDLFLAFVWLLISCLSFYFISFLFFFSFLLAGYLCVLSMHSSRGRLRTGAFEARWLVAPSCDE
jgi:hypothetical protein